MSYTITTATIHLRDDSALNDKPGRILCSRLPASAGDSLGSIAIYVGDATLILDDAAYARLKSEISRLDMAEGRSPKAVEPSADATAPGGAT